MSFDPSQTPEPATTPPVAPTAPVVVSTPPRKRGPLDYVLAAALVLAVGGVAFAVGRGTAPAAAAQFPVGGFGPGASFDPGAGFGPGTSFDPDAGFGGPGGFIFGGQTFDGTVTAIDADSITLQLADGSAMDIALDDDTTYHEATAADAATVQVGDAVQVRGAGGRPIGQGGGAAPSGGPGAGPITASDVTINR